MVLVYLVRTLRAQPALPGPANLPGGPLTLYRTPCHSPGQLSLAPQQGLSPAPGAACPAWPWAVPHQAPSRPTSWPRLGPSPPHGPTCPSWTVSDPCSPHRARSWPQLWAGVIIQLALTAPRHSSSCPPDNVTMFLFIHFFPFVHTTPPQFCQELFMAKYWHTCRMGFIIFNFLHLQISCFHLG